VIIRAMDCPAWWRDRCISLGLRSYVPVGSSLSDSGAGGAHGRAKRDRRATTRAAARRVRYRRAGSGVSLGTGPIGRNCRQPRYPGRSPRGPEVLRPRLSTGVPLSAIGLAPSMRTSVVRSALRQSLHRETRGRMISKQCCSAVRLWRSVWRQQARLCRRLRTPDC